MTGPVFFGPTPGVDVSHFHRSRRAEADPLRNVRLGVFAAAKRDVQKLLDALDELQTMEKWGVLEPAVVHFDRVVDVATFSVGLLIRELHAVVDVQQDGAAPGEPQVHPGVAVSGAGESVGQRDGVLVDVPRSVEVVVENLPDLGVQDSGIGSLGQPVSGAAVSEVDGHPGSLGATTGPVVDAGISEAEVKRLASEAIAGHLADEPNCEMCRQAAAPDELPPGVVSAANTLPDGIA